MKKQILMLIVLIMSSISIYAQLSVDIQITQPTCQNYYASVTAIASGGMRPYTYTWSTGQQDSVSYGMMPDQSFSITVTDANSESVIKSGTIDPMPQINAVPVLQNPTCFGLHNGSITFSVSGGTEPYAYRWNYLQNVQGPTATGLDAGSYYVEIRDAAGCYTSSEVSLQDPAKIELDSIVTFPACGANNGDINILVQSGGTPPFNFHWSHNSNFQPPIATALPAGNYTCTVTDASGCSNKINIALSNAGSFPPSTPMINHVSCYGGSNGSIDLMTPNGPLLWEDGSSVPSRQNLIAGDYYSTVTMTTPQKTTCLAVAAYTINQPDPLHIGINKTDLTCFNNHQGCIQLQVKGGTMNANLGDYTYVWSLPDFYLNSLCEIEAGTYTVTVTDGNNCTATESATVTQPDSLQFNFSIKNTCFGISSDGEIRFENVQGGTPPYEYYIDSQNMGKSLLSSKSSSPIIGDLGIGFYSLRVNDKNYCQSVYIDTSIIENSEIIISEIESIPADCHINNGGVNIGSIIGGTPNYTFEWSNGSNSQNLTTAGGGSHTLTITDAIGCTKSETFDVSQGELPTIEGDIFKMDGISTFNLNDLGIELYQINNGEATRVDSINNDETNTWYQFYQIQPGDYIIRASAKDATLYPNALSTYHGDTIKWEGATIVTVGCDQMIEGIDINMQEVPGFTTGGTGLLKGVVYYGNGIISTKSAGEPVKGKTILAEQEPDNDPIAFSTSDENGYDFSGVSAGTYNLWLDIPGIPVVQTHTGLVISSGTSIENLDFYIDTTSGNTGVYIDATSHVNNFESSNFSVEVYPNPYKENITISYNVKKESNVNIEIYDILGKKINNLINTSQKEGDYSINLNATKFNMNQGVYFVKITVDKTTFLKRIVSSK